MCKYILGGYHGYWPADYYSTNGHFGTAEDLKDVIATYQHSGESATANGQQPLFDISFYVPTLSKLLPSMLWVT